MSKKIAVFASGNGSNFQVIAEQFPVEFVFSDHRDAYVLERAEKLGVTAHAFELKEFDNKAAYEEAIVTLLEKYDIDVVCLAGYMKIVGPTLLAAYEGRIINIHPAYLPEFPGAHGIADAWNAGVSQSGVTVHWVDNGVDTGKVIKQVRVPRLADDTIDSFEARIHEAEYKLYPDVLESLGVKKKQSVYLIAQLAISMLPYKEIMMIKKILVFVLTFIVVAFIVNVLFGNLENPLRLCLAYSIGLIASIAIEWFIFYKKKQKVGLK